MIDEFVGDNTNKGRRENDRNNFLPICCPTEHFEKGRFVWLKQVVDNRSAFMPHRGNMLVGNDFLPIRCPTKHFEKGRFVWLKQVVDNRSAFMPHRGNMLVAKE